MITYAALLGAIALGSALAFGLGGREVAARMLEGAYTNVQENKHQWRRDLDQGLARARDEADAVTDRAHSIRAGAAATGPPAAANAFEPAWDDTHRKGL